MTRVAVIGVPGRMDFMGELLLETNGFATVGFTWGGERDVTIVPSSCVHEVKETEEHEIGSAGVGHVNYPHHPGYLYDCPACEAECFCDADAISSLCIYCTLEFEAARMEAGDE